MITESILNAFMFIPALAISLLPTIPAIIPDTVFDNVNSIFYGIGYVFPIVALLPIFAISLSVDLFRVVFALIVRIKSFIPNLGD